MWLLSTDRAELHYFISPEDVPGGYAILSHVWDKHEQTFQDIRALLALVKGTGAHPRHIASPKIRECCKLAESHGYKWLWIDTCCIDKTSSTELSEAINSMFRYYSLAQVCYAYLRDVPSDSPLLGHNSAFRLSRWHTRGWTLQELIAPGLLIFLSDNWEILGSKSEFAEVLEDITNIPTTVLRLEQQVGEVSVARRMSWAADRNTTRLEDEAYCLMGIFGINMPTLYGEGRHAFRRLQEEIMRQSIDPSLFAWSQLSHYTDMQLDSDMQSRRLGDPHDHSGHQSYLLATSPSAFKHSTELFFTPPRGVARSDFNQRVEGERRVTTHGKTPIFEPIGIPTFSITPYGIHARIATFEVGEVIVAILCCSRGEYPVGLILSPCPSAADPSRLLYHTGLRSVYRVVGLGGGADNLEFCGVPISARWRELYIAHWPPTPTSVVPPLLTNNSLSTPFRLPVKTIEKIIDVGYDLLDPSTMTLRVPPSWTGWPPVALAFKMKQTQFDVSIVLHLGRCTSGFAPTELTSESGKELGPHWANLQLFLGTPPAELPPHECPTDHICTWPDRTRTFLLKTGYWLYFEHTLSFTPCTINPVDTLVVHFNR